LFLIISVVKNLSVFTLFATGCMFPQIKTIKNVREKNKKNILFKNVQRLNFFDIDATEFPDFVELR